jgi:alpha-beta hydrolase superfamily lysophospholipase
VEFFNGSLCRLSAAYGEPLTRSTRGGVVCIDPSQPYGKGYFVESGLADGLRRAGAGVLLLNLNGIGDSENGNFDYPDDLVAASLALQSCMPGWPIGLLAVGAGASWGICALARSEHVYEAAVLDSPLLSDQFWSSSTLGHWTAQFLELLHPDVRRRLDPLQHIGDVRWIRSLLLLSHDAETTRTAQEMQRLCRADCAVQLVSSGQPAAEPQIFDYLWSQFAPVETPMRSASA